MADPQATAQLRRPTSALVRQFELVVVDGPDRGMRATSTGDELTLGTSAGNDLRLTDPAVSRHHCVVRVTARGLLLRDLSSTNGTRVAGCEIDSAVIPTGAVVRLIESELFGHVRGAMISRPRADIAPRCPGVLDSMFL